jgi:hypothetical protein
MIGLLFCAAAFLLAFVASRRGLTAGLGAVLAVGYVYGIVRANFPDPASHFIFDAAVLALYMTQLFSHQTGEDRARMRTIQIWTVVLIAWPVLLVFIPKQDYLVQLVGLRGNVFLLPFLLLGARLTRDDISRFAMSLATFNLFAFVFAAAEYVVGIERFFPRNTNTEIIYRSADVGGLANQFRIPGPFSGSHVFAGTMVMSLPFLLGAWAAPGTSRGRRAFLVCAMIAATLGVFAAASRVHTVILVVVLLSAMFSGRISAGARVLLFAVVGGLGAIVLSQERLQRFTTLSDTSSVSNRLTYSVNASFWDVLFEYPLGNGLGGGGTSLPYFLQDRLRGGVILENEYARIVLEQTSIGLCLWVTFIGWFLSRRFTVAARQSWGIGESTAWLAVVMYFGTALIGIGLLTAIPQSALFLLCAGWVAAKRPEPEALPEESVYEPEHAHA